MYKKIFIWLASILYPRGRAFRMPDPVNGVYYRLHSAIASVQDQTWQDALSNIDSNIADNPNFTIDDANLWYERLGIYNSGSVALSDMMLAINQKLNYPGDVIYGRSHYQFIEDQLRAAGFDVHVYENRFLVGGVYVTKTPGDILSATLPVAMHGFIQHGEGQHGQLGTSNVTKLVNYLEEDKDEAFDIGANYRSTFFVAGATAPTFAVIPAARRTEFRQLLLMIKPAQMCGYLFIHYT